MKKYSSYIFLLNPGRSIFKKRNSFIREDAAFSIATYHAIENTASKNAGKPLCIRQ